MTVFKSHARINTAEVCALARCSSMKLWRRIDTGRMPKPIDHAAGDDLFDRTAVLVALGMFDHDRRADQNQWDFDPRALAELRAARPSCEKVVRRRPSGAALRSANTNVPLSGRHSPPARVTGNGLADWAIWSLSTPSDFEKHDQ